MQFDIQKFLFVQIFFSSLSMIAMDQGQGEELQAASSSGDGSRVQELLNSGANPDGSTAFSPLFTALAALLPEELHEDEINKQNMVIATLLNGGATIDQDIFVLAAQVGRVDILRLGLQNPDVDINGIAADLGATALTMATLAKQGAAQDWLGDNGATE